MIKRCEVYEEKQSVGTVIMGRRGLYWAISCRCNAGKGRGKRLIAEGETGRVDLGLLYPVEGTFGLETSVPVRILGEGILCFCLEDPEEELLYFPLEPGNAFPHLQLLERCRFCIREGTACITLPKKK